MQKLHYSIEIHATPENVWNALWQEDNYTRWTSIFCKGSYYKTDSFTEGSSIHLLSPNGEGMYSIMEVVKPFSKLVFKHIGALKDFKELPLDAETSLWTNALESYSLTETNSGTILSVDVDTADEYIEYMNKSFPLALQELKLISETK